MGFGLAVGCVIVCVVDHLNAWGWAALGLVGLGFFLWGLRALFDVFMPPALELTTTGFTFRRAFAPGREVKWSELDTIAAYVHPKGAQACIRYRLSDGRKGSFVLYGTSDHDLVELMKDYRDLDAIGPQRDRLL
jgi:hypothetical protein